jgi:PilZ domain-containing protein
VVHLLGHTALVEAGDIAVTGTVDNVAGAAVTISCDEECWPEGDSRDVTISVFAPDALYRITGDAVSEEKGLRCCDEFFIERIQRRRWPRRRMDLPVTLCPVESASSFEGVAGRTVDISVGGACIETLRPVEGEGNPMVILRLPDGSTVVCGAATIAVEQLDDGWRYRVAFTDLASADASRLESLTAA